MPAEEDKEEEQEDNQDQTPCTIAPIPRLASEDFDYSDYMKAEKIGENKYLCRHRVNESKSITAEVEFDEEEKEVYWTGLPRAAKFNMKDFDYEE